MRPALTICTGFALAAACGGGGSSKPGTPAGTYSLTVAGTFNSGATTLAHNTKLTLLVQQLLRSFSFAALKKF